MSSYRGAAVSVFTSFLAAWKVKALYFGFLHHCNKGDEIIQRAVCFCPQQLVIAQSKYVDKATSTAKIARHYIPFWILVALSVHVKFPLK